MVEITCHERSEEGKKKEISLITPTLSKSSSFGPVGWEQGCKTRDESRRRWVWSRNVSLSHTTVNRRKRPHRSPPRPLSIVGGWEHEEGNRDLHLFSTVTVDYPELKFLLSLMGSPLLWFKYSLLNSSTRIVKTFLWFLDDLLGVSK